MLRSLWLNEGFATYMECVGQDHVEPGLRASERFPAETLQEALEMDAYDTSHPISVEVKHPDEIGEIFDDVSYKKGASVIRMMAEFLGKETFYKGVNSYIQVCWIFFNANLLEQSGKWSFSHRGTNLPTQTKTISGQP